MIFQYIFVEHLTLYLAFDYFIELNLQTFLPMVSTKHSVLSIFISLALISFTLAEVPSFGFLSDPFKAIPAQANQPFPEYVTALGYPVETHYITTSDGYINTYFRMQPKGSTMKKGLPVIYLQHGLVDSSDTWIVNSEDQAPGLILANAGYDVWCGNTRGNTYSQNHTTLNAIDPNSTYWNFSWQEMSQYDLPAAFEYIGGVTGQNISYIGHSQGTSIMFAALVRRDPTVLQYLKHYVALAPVVYVNHVISPFVDVLNRANLGVILNILNAKEFMFVSPPIRKALELICEYADAACIEQLKLISDTDPSVDNVARMDVIMGHFPAGTSAQNMQYWSQMLHDESFKMYDFGTKGNEEHYGQSTPPVMDLGKINVPVHLFAGEYDELAYLNSTELVKEQLTGSPQVTYNVYPMGHASFIWGLNVTSYIPDLQKILQS